MSQTGTKKSSLQAVVQVTTEEAKRITLLLIEKYGLGSIEDKTTYWNILPTKVRISIAPLNKDTYNIIVTVINITSFYEAGKYLIDFSEFIPAYFLEAKLNQHPPTGLVESTKETLVPISVHPKWRQKDTSDVDTQTSEPEQVS